MSAVGANARPRLTAMPPANPDGAERPQPGANDPITAKCENYAATTREMGLREGLQRRVVKVVITTSPRWGTIWRADSEVKLSTEDASSLWRTVCWKGGVLERPVTMFDPGEDVPVL